MTSITFVRHGVTDHNLENRSQGHTQNPLNETGRSQAGKIAKRLAEERWDLLIASDLRRAKETAEIISKALDKPIDFFDERIREKDVGKIANTIEQERVERWGKHWRTLDMQQETDEQIRARGRKFVEDIMTRYEGKKILVVTHGYFLGQTLKEIMGDETTGEHLSNTSVTTIVPSGEGWIYVDYDCVKHLDS